MAAAYLKDVQGVGEEESVVVCPVDPYVENDYFEALKALGDRAAVSSANLVLMGIEPTYPSEKYGYIIPVGKEQVSKVSMFKEKPTKEAARDYITKGALWNGGVFAYKLRYVLDKAHELIDFTDYHDLFNKYETLKKISFDYAVVENESKIQVMRFAGQWKDMGTWNTLTEAMEEPSIGKAILNDTCEGEYMYLFTADGFEGEMTQCDEGDLQWVEREFLNALPKWEGDQIFLDLLWQNAPFFLLTLRYHGDTLVEAVLNGEKIR